MDNLIDISHFITCKMAEKYPGLLKDLDEENLFNINFLEEFIFKNKNKLYKKMDFQDFEILIHHHLLLRDQCIWVDEDTDDFPEICLIYSTDLVIDLLSLDEDEFEDISDSELLTMKNTELKNSLKEENYEKAAQLKKEIDEIRKRNKDLL